MPNGPIRTFAERFEPESATQGRVFAFGVQDQTLPATIASSSSSVGSTLIAAARVTTTGVAK